MDSTSGHLQYLHLCRLCPVDLRWTTSIETPLKERRVFTRECSSLGITPIHTLSMNLDEMTYMMQMVCGGFVLRG